MVKEKEKPKVKKTVQQLIEEWVGPVKNLDSIRVTNVYNNRYRVDVFTYYKLDNDLYYRIKISQSYFVCIVEDEVMNLTVTGVDE